MPYINVNQVDRTLASSVKRQVETLVRSTPARNTETPEFFEYVIDVENNLFSGSFSNIYLAHHRASPEQPLVARVYEPTARIDARRSIYMKVLKHIGKLLRRKGDYLKLFTHLSLLTQERTPNGASPPGTSSSMTPVEWSSFRSTGKKRFCSRD